MKTQIIRPGLLVSLKTTLRGGVAYAKRTIEAEHQEGASSIAAWETTRVISDAAEHASAVVARSKARSLVTSVCCPSSFGLLCPQVREDALAAAIEEAFAVADAHNKIAGYTRLDVYVISGRIADNDEQAARAIGSEVRDLIAAMEQGVRSASPEVIREAANKARAISGMLSPEAAAKVSAAIKEVRSVAREIVRRVEKAGEQAASVVEGLKLEALDSARFAVLDLTEEGDSNSTQQDIPGRSIELEPVPPTQQSAPAIPAFELGD